MIKELNTVIGRDCWCPESPSRRVKLVEVGPIWSTVEVTPPSIFISNRVQAKVGKTFKLSTPYVYSIFFINNTP